MAQRRRLPSVLGEHWLETEDLKVIQLCTDVLLEQVTSMPPPCSSQICPVDRPGYTWKESIWQSGAPLEISGVLSSINDS